MGAEGHVRHADPRAVREDEDREHPASRGAKRSAVAGCDAGSRGGGLSGIWGSATASRPWPSTEPEGRWLFRRRTPERHDAGDQEAGAAVRADGQRGRQRSEGRRHRGCPAQHSRRTPGSTGAASEAATEAQEETSAGRSGQCGRGHPEKGRSGLTGSRNPRNVLPRAQEIGTADRPMVERLELVLTWDGRFSEEDRGADHTAAI